MQFDRAPQDVFAVQDEIAIEVARAMHLTLDAGTEAAAGLSRRATKSYEAYLAFLRGRALLANVRVADLPPAIDSLSAAIRHDPDFAAAYVLLARARVALADQSLGADQKPGFQQAVESALKLLDKAIALDPKSGEAYVERGYLKIYSHLAAADADLRKGLDLSPNYARGYEGLAAVLFQSVARRREALEMIEKARSLDPLAPHLDVLKATYLMWGPGEMTEAAQLLEAVLERDPLYVPAMARLGEVRFCGQGELAESIQLLEQAVALDPGNESAWGLLASSYFDVDELAATGYSLRRVENDPELGGLLPHLYRKEWRQAGEAAYRRIAAGSASPKFEPQVALAIRRHAHATGEYRQAIETLENWASVTWDDDEPLLQGDMLMATGQQAKATVLLEQLLADIEIQISHYGRGEVWLNNARSVALALLDRPDEAMAVLQRQARLRFAKHAWRVVIEYEPAYDSLRERKDFQALLAAVRANADREREQLKRMRADGLVPSRN
jgi:tetratricopeptide (TPR) repeat protein